MPLIWKRQRDGRGDHLYRKERYLCRQLHERAGTDWRRRFYLLREGWLLDRERQAHPPIKDINIIGNGPKALADITMVGNNYKMDNGTWTCGKDGQSCPVTCGMPSALVSKLTVGGEN